ncbi:MAG: hypothetical protein RLY23_107, partial [Actinomycetota bacterium]
MRRITHWTNGAPYKTLGTAAPSLHAVHDPVTGATQAEVELASREDVDFIVSAAT